MSYLKRLTNAALGRLQAFRMYGGIGMSVSSLHRESTDSLIPVQTLCIDSSKLQVPILSEPMFHAI